MTEEDMEARKMMGINVVPIDQSPQPPQELAKKITAAINEAMAAEAEKKTL